MNLRYKTIHFPGHIGIDISLEELHLPYYIQVFYNVLQLVISLSYMKKIYFN